jgi:hypothetical protein
VVTNTHNGKIVGRVVFYVVRLVSKEDGRLVLPRIYSLVNSKNVRLTENIGRLKCVSLCCTIFVGKIFRSDNHFGSSARVAHRNAYTAAPVCKLSVIVRFIATIIG